MENFFKGLTRFVGTKTAYDSLDKAGKLVFAQITGATGDVAPYYLYANDKEFAFNSYDQFKDLASKVVYDVTGDAWLNVTGSTSLTITHKTQDGVSGSYSGSLNTQTSGQVEITIPTFTVDEAGHLTAAGTTSATIDASNFGLAGAMHFRGAVAELPNISGDHDYINGDVVVVTSGDNANKEFVFVGATGETVASWVELGDESRYANNTTKIIAGDGLTGGGDLTADRTISLNQDSIDALGRANSAIQNVVAGNTGVVVEVSDHTATVSHASYTAKEAAAVKVGRDEFGHVTTGDALTASDITISDVTGLTGTNVKEDFDQVVAKINAVDSKSYTVVGSTYIDATSTTEGDTTTATVSAKITKLGDAVGMTQGPDGNWVAASGVVSDGLVTAADVAAEIVADEQVIATALNDHESRLDAIESALTWSVIG